MQDVYALVMAGGSGTRFWPASRKLRPKQLLPIAPGSDRSLIESTVERIAPLCPPDRVVIATGAHLLDATRAVLQDLPEEAFLGEPLPRNTAACIGWATAVVARRDPDALVMALPSDHHVAQPEAFLDVVRSALRTAASGTITTIGIEPTRPDTGYGYIEAGEALGGGARRVLRFVEKPDRATAEGYLAAGRYYWNSGMFFFRAGDMLDAIREHMPELGEGLASIDQAAQENPATEAEVTRGVFEALSSVSIDYGVMEKMGELAVVPGSFGWSDLGSWDAAYDLSHKDDGDNACPEGTVAIDASRNLVVDRRSGEGRRVIALVGVDDLVVVETDDALLIMHRDRSQDVREVVRTLEASGRDRHT